MDVKVGDVVHVRGTVKRIQWDSKTLPYQVSFGDGSLHSWVPTADIVHVEPRPLAVGDEVTWGNGLTNYRILHIDNRVAFLRGPGYAIHAIDDLRRSTEAP